MAIFSYKGLDQAGRDVKSTINAEGVSQAKTKLRSMGIMLIEIKEQKSDTSKKSAGFSFSSGVSIEELSLMTRQLATLVKAKIQIVEALSALMDQTENAKLRVVLSEIRGKVNEGYSLAKSLADYPKVFNNVYVNMVEAGEASGNLEIVLIRLADFTEAQSKLKSKIKGAMLYPVIMASVGFIMMMIIFIFVIPKITKIFTTMKRELPFQTKLCIWISEFLQNYWWAVIVGLFASYYMFRKYIAKGKGQARWHSLVLKMPIAGNIVTMINVSRFCSTLATLLNSGVNILVSMNIVKNLINNVHMQQAIAESRTNVKEGASLTAPLLKSGLFPPMVTHMIKLGERSGELEEMLTIISENYEEQVDTKLSGLTSTLEPLMMIGMGLAVAFIIASVIVPMMELNTIR
ncbi:MAG: type II secretion system inner membrane protein GspF [Bacteriovoracaceae bacterium]|nr:type II secretion system inner membrane protein GspF [Bacteriovoracaceae bacterium]